MKQHHLLHKGGLAVLLLRIVLPSFAASVSFSWQHAYAASAVTINGATTFQTMDGFGFSAAFDGSNSLPTALTLNGVSCSTS